jgi:hypothetical protein
MIKKGKKVVKEFESEFKKSLNTALLAAFAFLIALTWRDLINNTIDNFLPAFSFCGELIVAVFITVICTIGIMLTSKFLAEKAKEEAS